MKRFTVALAGTPNVGKSTLFNRLTGGNVHVANWPGVTLQRHEGKLNYRGAELKIIDLPGAYSLSARDIGEKIARDFIINEKPDVLVLIADATSLEKSLYFVVNALELYGRVVIAVNMVDAAEKRGIHVNFEGLEEALGVPVVPVSALKGWGIGKLLRAVLEVAEGGGRWEPLRIDYDGLEKFIERIEASLREAGFRDYPSRWAAIRILEGDEELRKKIMESNPELSEEIAEICEEAKLELAADPESIAIASRYDYVNGLLRGNVRRVKLSAPKLEETLDEVLLNPIIGPISALLILLSVFLTVFTVNTGFPLNLVMEWIGAKGISELIENYSLTGIISSVFDWISETAASELSGLGFSEWVTGFVSEGLLGSLGTLISFVPLLLTTYLIMGALQDSGILSRSATTLDSFFRKFGLSGKAFFPAIIGLGCSVPGVIASRGLEDEEERTVVAMTEPFIPCQARLVVLLAISAAAFNEPETQAITMLSLYVLNFLTFLVSSKVLRKLLFKSSIAPELLMELPPYHRPSMRVVWWYAKYNTLHFLRKAGILIFSLGSATWFLLNFGPNGYSGDPSKSFASMMGEGLAPLLAPIGLNDWRYALALEVGFVAKEGLLVIFSSVTGISDPVAAIRAVGITPLKAISLAAFMNLYVPCLATVATILYELRNPKYLVTSISVQLISAFIVASLLHWLGFALGLE